MHLSRYATKMEVLELLKRSGYVLHVMVVVGGLWATPLPPSSRTRGKGYPPLISREKVEQRHLKAKAFQSKVIKSNTHTHTHTISLSLSLSLTYSLTHKTRKLHTLYLVSTSIPLFLRCPNHHASIYLYSEPTIIYSCRSTTISSAIR